jgi:hypothetical protein
MTQRLRKSKKVETSNRFATLEYFDESLDTSSARESIRENIKTSAKENIGYHKLKHNKSWFDYECTKLIDQRKQDKLQSLKNLSQINGHNLQNVRRETGRKIRNKEREYLKGKINELETND